MEGESLFTLEDDERDDELEEDVLLEQAAWGKMNASQIKALKRRAAQRARAKQLPILNCDGCGACCMEMRSPPFCLSFDPATNLPIPFDPDMDADDYEWFTTAPAQARAAFHQGVDASLETRPDASPCSWLDLRTMRCRFYEHRPQICRDFKIGSEACRLHREREEIE